MNGKPYISTIVAKGSRHQGTVCVILPCSGRKEAEEVLTALESVIAQVKENIEKIQKES